MWYSIPLGLLNPGATAFYPMVPGANCFQRAGVTSEPSPEPAPGLPHFGVGPQADLTPFTSASPLEAHPQGAGGVPTNTNVPQYVQLCYPRRSVGITRASRRGPPAAPVWMQV